MIHRLSSTPLRAGSSDRRSLTSKSWQCEWSWHGRQILTSWSNTNASHKNCKCQQCLQSKHTCYYRVPHCIGNLCLYRILNSRREVLASAFQCGFGISLRTRLFKTVNIHYFCTERDINMSTFASMQACSPKLVGLSVNSCFQGNKCIELVCLI